MRQAIGIAAALLATVAMPSGCHRSPMSKIEALRDALVVGNRDDALSVVEVPPCPEPHTQASMTPCLVATARAFGAMMEMKKIDVAKIEAAVRGE